MLQLHRIFQPCMTEKFWKPHVQYQLKMTFPLKCLSRIKNIRKSIFRLCSIFVSFTGGFKKHLRRSPDYLNFLKGLLFYSFGFFQVSPAASLTDYITKVLFPPLFSLSLRSTFRKTEFISSQNSVGIIDSPLFLLPFLQLKIFSEAFTQ